MNSSPQELLSSFEVVLDQEATMKCAEKFSAGSCKDGMLHQLEEDGRSSCSPKWDNHGGKAVLMLYNYV